MLMRFLGGGIGHSIHYSTQTSVSQQPGRCADTHEDERDVHPIESDSKGLQENLDELGEKSDDDQLLGDGDAQAECDNSELEDDSENEASDSQSTSSESEDEDKGAGLGGEEYDSA